MMVLSMRGAIRCRMTTLGAKPRVKQREGKALCVGGGHVKCPAALGEGGSKNSFCASMRPIGPHLRPKYLK
jgi:hypothetical protein